MPSAQRSGALPGANTSRRSLVVSWASRRSLGSVSVDAVNAAPTGAWRNHGESGGRLYTTAWCTWAGLDGRTSTIWTHSFSVKCVGTISYVYWSLPWAGIATACVIFKTTSGRGIFQPSLHLGGGGASCGSPAGAPDFSQAAMVAICSSVSDVSLAKCP